MKYLTIGKDEITYDKFIKIVNNSSNSCIKPSGGLWLTKHNEDINYSIWMDYILEHRSILFYKYGEYLNNEFSWKISCSLVELSNNTNIFSLDSYTKFLYLLKKYPLSNEFFSYEDMAKDYDGIYINLNWIYDNKIINFEKFGVDSLLLFNLDCIDNYRAGKIFLEPFDFDDYNLYDNVLYNIKIDNLKRKVLR